jgi:hypothetical protein
MMRLQSVRLLYESTDATIESVTIHDGQKALQDFPNLLWTGRHDSFDGTNLLRLSTPADVSTGLVVGITVKFEQPSQSLGVQRVSGSVRLLAIGAVFEPGAWWARIVTSFASMFGGPPEP